MATFANKAMIDQMMANDGWLPGTGDRNAPDNPPASRIVEYVNSVGKLAWGVVFEGEPGDPLRYETPSEYVRRPRLIWVRGEGPK
jgi:hypothetical protein